MAIDAFDYKEPACALCGGEDFYNYDPDKQQGSIPLPQIIAKIDDTLNREDYAGAERILNYWLAEARQLKDLRGELGIESELMGLYRKNNEEEKALEAVRRGLEIIDILKLDSLVSTATIFINAATVLKTFDRAEQALELYKKAEAVYNDNLPDGDALFGALYNNMGLALADLDMTQEAEQSFNKANEIMQSLPGGQLESAITYLNIADLYFEDDEKTATLIEKAYSLLTDPTQKQNTYCAFVYKKCAPAFSSHGYFLLAKELNERAEKIYARN